MNTEYKCNADNWPLTDSVVYSGNGYCNILHGYGDCKDCRYLQRNCRRKI